MRTTQQNLDIMAGPGEVLLNLLLCDESGPTSPTGRGVVEYIEDREPGGVNRGQLVQFGPEQDILWVNIGVNKAELGLVRRVLEGGADDLEHGSDSGSPSDHSELTRQVRGIDEFTLGTLDLHFVSNVEEGHMARDVTLLVGLAKVQHRVGQTDLHTP